MGNIQLANIDDLFKSTTPSSKQDDVINIPIVDLHEFSNHPFKVVENEDMQNLIESIEKHGVINPLIVRQSKTQKNMYEIVSGHRRFYASQKLKLENIPAIIKDIDDDTATILMVDSNLQREKILPSEKAFSYKMKLEAMKRQAGRPSKENVSPLGTQKRSDQLLAEQTGESRNQIQRYIRLTNLNSNLLNLVDEDKIKLRVSVELSFLSEEIQFFLLQYIEENSKYPSMKQAEELRKLKDPTYDDIDKLLTVKKKEKTIKFKNKEISKYLPCATLEEQEEYILNALKFYKGDNENE